MAFVIGDTVATKHGKIGRLLGVLAGVAHIGLPEKKIITAQVADLTLITNPVAKMIASVPPEIKPSVDPVVELSDKVEVRDELEVVQYKPVELGDEDKKFIEGRAEVAKLEANLIDAVRVPAELLNLGVRAPENMTREWLTGTPIPTLKEILEIDKTLSAPRKSKIRKAIRERENGQQPVVEPEGSVPSQ